MQTVNQPNGEVWTSPNQTKQGPRERSIKIGELKLGEKDLGGLAVQRFQSRAGFLQAVQAAKKWRWAGHVSRARNTWTNSVTEWSPLDKKRNRGRQFLRWRDEIRK
ncbi:uncharacterized protein [Rhodnius prolixus]|uniref:uncharacterized protein n=1 Tax=Rhodnius prolixus TaxID=13249 RepID=UPI003D189464